MTAEPMMGEQAMSEMIQRERLQLQRVINHFCQGFGECPWVMKPKSPGSGSNRS